MFLRFSRVLTLKVLRGFWGCLHLDSWFDANVVNIFVHFIRARSNLILSCSSKGFPMYICCSVKRRGGGEG